MTDPTTNGDEGLLDAVKTALDPAMHEKAKAFREAEGELQAARRVEKESESTWEEARAEVERAQSAWNLARNDFYGAALTWAGIEELRR